MPRPSTGLVLAGGLATAIALAIAWPILFTPSQLVYGHEIVGRHPEILGLIVQFGAKSFPGTAGQPLTDMTGWLLSRVLHPVAAFNLVLLLSFPLTALTTYALARKVTDSHGAALVAATAFTFSPFRLAHAAYHPYLVQTQWLPLYMLALVLLVDRVSPARVTSVAATAAGLLLSSHEIAFIGVVVSPAVIATCWIVRPDADRNWRPLVWPSVTVAAVAAASVATMASLNPGLWPAFPGLSVSLDDVAFYRARWWAYLIPPVSHPLLQPLADDLFRRAGGDAQQLAEQQLSLGLAFLLLALLAVVTAVRQWSSRPGGRVLIALAGVGLTAGLISVGPISGSCEPASLAPGCLLFRATPLLSAYARFGLVLELCVAVLAGAGAMTLARSRRGQAAAGALLLVGAFEYWPLPARVHDVLPTSAHRWIAGEPPAPVLDCYPLGPVEQFIPGLANRPFTFLGDQVATCEDPDLGQKLVALGYAYVVVRHGNASSKPPQPLPVGLSPLRAFDDADVYAVAASPPPLVTIATSGFYRYDHRGDSWWRWMSTDGQWTVRNTTTAPRRASLSVDLVSIGVPRTLTVTLDGRPAGTITVGLDRRVFQIGPWLFSPGDHALVFSADGDPIRPSDVDDASRDSRALAIAFRNDRWIDVP